jgi:outer membrane lipoprotein-sorting protein
MYFFLLFFCFFSFNVAGEDVDLNKDPRLKTIETYFNALKNLKASFLQTNNAGAMLSGTLYLKKPGKMRADYGETSPLLIISDGIWMTNYDKDLKQSSHIPLSSSPAEMLLRETFSFEGTQVNRIQDSQGLLKITLNKRDDIAAGTFTFIFTQVPFELREWVAVDGQGNVIRVSLTGVTKNIPLDDKLFIAPKNEAFSSN